MRSAVSEDASPSLKQAAPSSLPVAGETKGIEQADEELTLEASSTSLLVATAG